MADCPPSSIGTWLQAQRWFAGKGRIIESVQQLSELPLASDRTLAWQVLEVGYPEAEPENYLVCWPTGTFAQLTAVTLEHPPVEWVTTSAGLLALWQELTRGTLAAWTTEEFQAFGQQTPECSARWAPFEQSNTCVIFDERYILKIFRKLSAGMNPDVEIGRALAERSTTGVVPQLHGMLALEMAGKSVTVGVMHQYLHGAKTAWDVLLEYLHTAIKNRDQNPLSAAMGHVLNMAAALGRLTAEMHQLLAQAPGADFAAEPWTADERDQLRNAQTGYSAQQIALLTERLTQLPLDTQPMGQLVIDRQQTLLERFAAWRTVQHCGQRVRIHGDYHLGQILVTAKPQQPEQHDLWVIDFEGEPARPLEERRRKRSPLQDVAGMIRSLHYAVSQTRLAHAPTPNGYSWAAAVYPQMVAAFITTYDAQLTIPDLLPAAHDPDRRAMLELFILEKSLYELGYELLNRPDWIQVPLSGIAELIEE